MNFSFAVTRIPRTRSPGNPGLLISALILSALSPFAIFEAACKSAAPISMITVEPGARLAAKILVIWQAITSTPAAAAIAARKEPSTAMVNSFGAIGEPSDTSTTNGCSGGGGRRVQKDWPGCDVPQIGQSWHADAPASRENLPAAQSRQAIKPLTSE